jgi:hypothetical protein
MGRPFVGVQVAFAFCLVTGGARFLFSLSNLTAVNPGFDPKGVTVFTMSNNIWQWERQITQMQQIQNTNRLPSSPAGDGHLTRRTKEIGIRGRARCPATADLWLGPERFGRYDRGRVTGRTGRLDYADASYAVAVIWNPAH